MKAKKKIIIALVVLALIPIIKNIGINAEQRLFIRNLNSKAKNKFRQFIKRVQKETGYDVIITSGYRTFEKQQQLYDSGQTTARAGNSFHNYGMAIDINLIRFGKYIGMINTKSAWLETGVPQIAEEMGLRWGGNFSSFYDPVHFDLGNEYPLSSLKNRAEQLYGSNPSDIQGNLV